MTRPTIRVHARDGFHTHRQRGIRFPDGTILWADDLDHRHRVPLPEERRVAAQDHVYLPEAGVSSASASSWETYVAAWRRRLIALGLPSDLDAEPVVVSRLVGLIVDRDVTVDDGTPVPADTVEEAGRRLVQAAGAGMVSVRDVEEVYAAKRAHSDAPSDKTPHLAEGGIVQSSHAPALVGEPSTPAFTITVHADPNIDLASTSEAVAERLRDNLLGSGMSVAGVRIGG